MTTYDSARAEIQTIVTRFKNLKPAERKNLNEQATRLGYILPLFRALGWTTDDTNEVSPEEKVSRGWVDFSFRLGSVPRFFLETKRADEDLNDPRWVKQAIDYAWTKGVTWAVLSDFEELRLFNAEWQEENPFKAEFIRFNVDSYLTDFDRLWWLSRDQVAAGTLNAEADKVGKRLHREPVSQNLFDDLKSWRHDLFSHLHAYNKMHSPAQIDEAVLRLLNRLIFVRTAEDREVEANRLLALVRELKEQNKLTSLPKALARLFREFDETYNSELFAKHFSEELDCESKPYEDLIHDLYEKRFVRYNFNAIDADVLGTAYEQYLGHVITNPEAAEVVEKKQKRKSQGIYYTPTFVTKYIVQQTLGRYLDEQGYDPSKPVRVLDMACGSGSFLLEAFDTLDRFVMNMRGQSTPTPTLPRLQKAQTGEGAYSDVHDQMRRMEILTQCIYGVDKDKQAVEVARLNLLLRALHRKEKLPMLANIREGDSLISGAPDELKEAFGKEWKEKKAFNWESEFPEVFKQTSRKQTSEVLNAGGFDVIIGNPPWGSNIDNELKYFHSNYPATTKEHTDSFKLFVERSLRLIRSGGMVGMIVPNTLLRQRRLKDVRELMLQNEILVVANLGEDVFKNVVAPSCIFIMRKGKPPIKHQVFLLDISKDTVEHKPNLLLDGKNLLENFIEQNVFLDNPDREFTAPLRTHSVPTVQLGDFEQLECKDAGINYQRKSVGMQAKGKSDLADRLLYEGQRKKIQDKMYWKGTDINRYWIADKTQRYCRPDYHRFIHANEVVHLSKKVYEATPKILFRQTADRIIATIDYKGVWFGRSIIAILPAPSSPYSIEYFLGLLNSRYFESLYRHLSQEQDRVFAQVKLSKVKQLPIRRINFDDAQDKARHDAIVKLVSEMLEKQKEFAEAEQKLEDTHALKRRIEQIDREIDGRVYELNGLTKEEIEIVEGKR